MSATVISPHYKTTPAAWRAVRLPWHQVVGQGRASNERNIPFENCPYTEEPNRTFWQRGWNNKPMTKHEAAELQKKGNVK